MPACGITGTTPHENGRFVQARTPRRDVDRYAANTYEE
jgi:hypothetical protein